MKTLVLDSHPIIAFFEKQSGWETVAELFRQGADGKHLLLLTLVNWGEIYYITLREYGEQYAERVLAAVDDMPIELVEVDRQLAAQAVLFKSSGGLAYADCFAAALAKLRKAELVTGDREFEKLEEQLKIRWTV